MSGIPDVTAGACPTCGKVRHRSRRAARRFARRWHGKHSGLRPYRCGRYFHLGHLADPIRHGDATRDAIYRPEEHTA